MASPDQPRAASSPSPGPTPEPESGFKRELKIRLAIWAFRILHGLFGLTYRFRKVGRSWAERRADGVPGRCIYAAWHSYMVHFQRPIAGTGVGVLVSTHRDGEIIARVLGGMGFKLVRGSSTRGGAQALRELKRFVKEEDGDLCITVDGPKGPRREVKEGVLFTASRTGLPIVPLGLWAEPRWELNSWDRTLIAKPFAKIGICFGDPVEVPPGLSRDELDGVWKARVSEALDAAEARARRAVEGSAAEGAAAAV